MADSLIGTTLLGYTILREIGEGGMGKVYLAENQMIGQQVAIKILDPLLARNPDLRERFAQEARIQVALQHQTIVRVLNAQSSEELSFFVIEYIEGQSLDKVLKRRKKLPVDEALAIFKQVLDAVGHAHDKGVVHRDLKPSNIIVCADGTAKVTDFGIAKVIGDTKLTRTETSMGSPDYMSPEQVLGKKDIDHRTDIYSLGATLYEMLTGRPPFALENGGTSDSDFLVKQAHVQSTAEEPKNWDNSIAEQLSAAIMKSINKQPMARFESCKHFSRALFFKERPKETRKIRNLFSKHSAMILFVLVIAFSSAAAFFIRSNQVSLGTLLCGLGHASECFSVARAYHKGELVYVNWFKAKELYSKACDLGSHESCVELGLFLNNGLALIKDEQRAQQLYLSACQGGNARGCTYAGYGAEKMKKADLSLELFRKACELNDSSGCQAISFRYSTGSGIEKSEDLAKEFASKAKIIATEKCIKQNQIAECEDLVYNFDIPTERKEHFEQLLCKHYNSQCVKSFADSCSKLAYSYEFARCGEKNELLALELNQKACDLGSPSACQAVGNHYQGIEFSSYIRELPLKYYEKSCEGGLSSPCARIVSDHIRREIRVLDSSRVRKFAESACNSWVAQSCLELGEMLKKGDGGKIDKTLARKMIKKSCDLGWFDGCRSLAYSMIIGDLGETDIRKGRIYFTEACEKGDQISCANLKALEP